jgi:hypothetical protein
LSLTRFGIELRDGEPRTRRDADIRDKIEVNVRCLDNINLVASACLSGFRRTKRYSAVLYAQCHDADEANIRQTEGPYFKPSSPQRADLIKPDTKARLVEINGQVRAWSMNACCMKASR